MARLIVVIFGLMGTGKTTLARALGAARGWPVIHSDVVRKALAGLTPTTPTPQEYGQGIYDEDFSRRTYAEMRRLAGEHLKSAQGVILDASFKGAGERAEVRDLAREGGARAVFVCCACPLKVVRRRLEVRAQDAASISDGRLELLARQEQDFDPPGAEDRPLLILDTGREMDEILREVEAFLEAQTTGPPG
jgi:predicted kinase